MDRIVVENDCLWFGETKAEPPFDRKKIDGILGKPRVDQWEYRNVKGERAHMMTCLWDSLGIRADVDKQDSNVYKSFTVYVAGGERYAHSASGTFTGRVMIGEKEYTECEMKYDSQRLIHECRKGIFDVYTFLISELDAVGDEQYRDTLKVSSRSVEICCNAAKVRTKRRNNDG